jgi:WD40 repeat protein
MGVVYHARQTRLGRTVALKVVLAGAHASPSERQRFQAEAEAVAALSHPGIVQVYECGECAGQPYLALEYCPGGSLAAKLHGTPLPPQDAAALVEQLARAVQAAHAKGIVHRDLKPENVLLAADGTPKVTDFGLVKRVESGERLTATGAIMGTPSYMAPEQAGDGQAVGPAADVYALGAILYECLTGRPPFRAATALDTVLQVVSQEPVSVRSLNLQVPVDLETICQKCLQKEPVKRYASAAALADDLRRYLEGRPVVARPVGAVERAWRWGRRNPALAAALATAAMALVIGTTVSIAFGVRASRSAQVARDEAGRAETEAKNATAATAREKERADGEQKARRDSQRLLGLMNVDQGLREADAGRLSLALLRMVQPLVVDANNPDAAEMARVRLANYRQYTEPQLPVLAQFWSLHGDVHSAAFSPDGRQVVTVSGNEARVWDAATGQPLTPSLTHEGAVRSAAFSPDGRRVVTASVDGTARVWDTATGQPLTLSLKHRGNVQSAVFSPDGRRVVTASGDLQARVGEARVWDAATGQPLTPPLTHGGAVVAFSPDGHRVVTASRDQTARVWDAATGQPLTPPLAHGGRMVSAAFSPGGRRVVTVSANGVTSADFSPDGRWVVTASGDGTARVWDAATGQPATAPLVHGGGVYSAAFSPDGRRVVTASVDGTARVWDTATGQPLTLSLPHGNTVVSAAFSPDGRRMVTASDREARVWDAATGQPLTPPLTHRGTVSRSPAFSPDGRRVVTASVDATARVWDAATGQPLTLPLTHGGWVRSAAFSPDGRWVVTASVDKSARVWDAATGQPLTPPLKHGGSVLSAAFSPDGRRVVTASDREARVWDVSEDPRPVGDLVRLVQLLSSHRIDDTGAAVPLADEEMQRLWDDLRAKYPADFTASPAAARAWREKQIGACLREGNLDAAQFHYRWLVAEMVQTAQHAGAAGK